MRLAANCRLPTAAGKKPQHGAGQQPDEQPFHGHSPLQKIKQLDAADGERKADAIQSVQVKHLQGAKKWKPGMVAWVNTDHGERQVTIVKMGMFKADVDTNHPLAGKTVTFHIEILSVREATEEELAHGHAHGAGGHQH